MTCSTTESERLTVKGLLSRSALPNNTALAVIGISPFSSKFTYENISSIVEWISCRYSNFKLFIPDLPTTFSLLSMGYADVDARKKMKKQCRYLKNKCERAISEFDRHLVKHERVITYDSLEQNPVFCQKLELVLSTYKNNKLFKTLCDDFSYQFLLKNKIPPSNNSIYWSTQYILYEMPIFLFSKEVFEYSDAFFVYPNCPSFLKNIIGEGRVSELKSQQEFLEYQIWR